jgi:hypothetical protein
MRDCKRIGNIMKRMKWEKGRRRQIHHTNPVDGYIKPEAEVLTDEQARCNPERLIVKSKTARGFQRGPFLMQTAV